MTLSIFGPLSPSPEPHTPKTQRWSDVKALHALLPSLTNTEDNDEPTHTCDASACAFHVKKGGSCGDRFSALLAACTSAMDRFNPNVVAWRQAQILKLLSQIVWRREVRACVRALCDVCMLCAMCVCVCVCVCVIDVFCDGSASGGLGSI
jgi:hypothetical protein